MGYDKIQNIVKTIKLKIKDLIKGHMLKIVFKSNIEATKFTSLFFAIHRIENFYPFFS